MFYNLFLTIFQYFFNVTKVKSIVMLQYNSYLCVFGVYNKNKRNNHFVCNCRKRNRITVIVSQIYKILNDISKLIRRLCDKGKKIYNACDRL